MHFQLNILPSVITKVTSPLAYNFHLNIKIRLESNPTLLLITIWMKYFISSDFIVVLKIFVVFFFFDSLLSDFHGWNWRSIVNYTSSDCTMVVVVNDDRVVKIKYKKKIIIHWSDLTKGNGLSERTVCG